MSKEEHIQAVCLDILTGMDADYTIYKSGLLPILSKFYKDVYNDGYEDGWDEGYWKAYAGYEHDYPYHTPPHSK